MLYCDKCAELRQWPTTLFRSYGPCEACGRSANCNSMKTKDLPPPATYCISNFEEFILGMEEDSNGVAALLDAAGLTEDTIENRRIAYEDFKNYLRSQGLLCEDPKCHIATFPEQHKVH